MSVQEAKPDESTKQCCNFSTRKTQLMNARIVLDAIAIAVCLFSGVGIFMLTGLFGGDGTISFWFMVIYALFSSIMLCNCCQCTTGTMKWIGIIDLIIRCVSIVCTGLTIGELRSFANTHLNSNDDFTVAVLLIIDAATLRIAVTLIIQLLAFSVTTWWMYLAFYDKSVERVTTVSTSETELTTKHPV